MEDKLNEWKSQQLNIALVGGSGVGKSSFVKTIRGVRGVDQEHGAHAGFNQQASSEPKSYADPINPNLVYWDLASVDTADFRRDETCLHKIERYDFFLIFTATRFREEDHWLATNIRRVGKKFFFIRGRIDEDIENEREDHPKDFCEVEVLANIKEEIERELLGAGFRNSKIFLISNKEILKWEFPLLCETLITELEGLKREAFTLSILAVSPKVLQEKERLLYGRIKAVSALSAMGAWFSFPGVSCVANALVISAEYNFYKLQLRLDDESLDRLSQELAPCYLGILQAIRSDETMQLNDLNALMRFMRSWAKSMVAEEVSKLFFGIGTVISSGISYWTTSSMLSTILSRLVANSRRIVYIAASNRKLKA